MPSGIYRSAHKYKNADDPDADKTFVTRVHPLVRTHPVTGWKALWGESAYHPHGTIQYTQIPSPSCLNHAPLPLECRPLTAVNQAMTVGIEGFDQPEADLLLKYLYDVYERSTDIQVRWHWTPGTSAIWDNRSTIHTVSYDYEGERHGTRVSSLAEKPFFEPGSKSRAEALNIEGFLGKKDYARY